MPGPPGSIPPGPPGSIPSPPGAFPENPVWIAGIGWVYQGTPQGSNYIPGFNYQAFYDSLRPGAQVATPADMDDVAPEPPKSYLPISAEGALLPVAYGRVTLTPKYGVIYSRDGDIRNFYLLLVWCKGEVEEIEAVYAGQLELGTTIGIENYVGDQTQNPSPYLQNPTWGIGPDYVDDLRGYCYTVVELDATVLPNFPTFRAIVKGLRLYDPRTDTTAYSTNPALMYRNAALSMGLLVDDGWVEATADACDEELPSGDKRRECGIYFDKAEDGDKTLRVLAEYAGAYHFVDGKTCKLIPNRPASVTTSFTWDETDGTKKKIVEGSFKLKKRAKKNAPNRIVYQYTDTSQFPWRRGLAVGDLPVGETLISTRMNMPGVQSFSQANRNRIERQNRYNLIDLDVRFRAFDDSLELEVGDVFDIDSPDLNAKKFRCLDVQAAREPGQWDIVGEEYDPLVFSNEEQSEPTYPDTQLPNPDDIPVGPTPTDVYETLWTDASGRTHSVAIIEWNASTWYWTRWYHVKVSSATETIFDSVIPANPAIAEFDIQTQPTQQGVQYTVEISLINPSGREGSPSQTLYTGSGNQLPPSGVSQSSMVSYEFGQFVHISHDPAVDTDLEGYRWKRLDDTYYTPGDPEANWDHGQAQTIASRHDAPEVLFSAQPEGTYWYGVKAIDSRGNLSNTSAWIQQEITVEGAGAVSFAEPDPGVSFNMHFYENVGATIGGEYATTDFGANSTLEDIWGASGQNFPSNQSVPFLTAAIQIFNMFGANYVFTEEWDTGSDRSGQWYGKQAEVTKIDNPFGTANTPSINISLATDAAYPTFTPYLEAVVQARARYAKYQVIQVGNNGDYMTVKMPARISFQGVVLTDIITVNIPASPQPHSFNWTKDFTDSPVFDYVVIGSTPRTIAFENVDNNGGDVRAWDENGVEAAATIQITATGP